jgi:hypothetical protein
VIYNQQVTNDDFIRLVSLFVKSVFLWMHYDGSHCQHKMPMKQISLILWSGHPSRRGKREKYTFVFLPNKHNNSLYVISLNCAVKSSARQRQTRQATIGRHTRKKSARDAASARLLNTSHSAQDHQHWRLIDTGSKKWSADVPLASQVMITRLHFKSER